MFVNFNRKYIKYLVFIIITLLVAVENYLGTGGVYSFIYEFVEFNNIFTHNNWTYKVENSPQYLPLRLLKFFGFDLTNDFFLLSLYLVFGAIAIFYLNKIIYFFFNVYDFDKKLIILTCSAFANFIVLKSVWSSTFLPFENLQTYCAIQLVYPLFYYLLRERFTLSSLLSSLIIFLHFTVAWFPTLILVIYIFVRTKSFSFKILNIFFPFLVFLIMYYLNLINTIDQNQFSNQLLLNILDRSKEESILLLQGPQRIVYFIFSLIFFAHCKKKIIRNENLHLLLSIVFYLTIFFQLFGAFWTIIGYKFIPIKSFAYLYFVRAVLSYHIFFIILGCCYLMSLKIPNLIKLSLFLGIYIMSKAYFSEKSIYIASFIVTISISTYFISQKTKIVKSLSLNNILYILFFVAFLIQLYLIDKNVLNRIDNWSIKNINDLSQRNFVFSNKNITYKNAVLNLRKCNDFMLLPIINKKNIALHDNYINILSHKSVYYIDEAMYFDDFEDHLINKKNGKLKDELVNKINSNINLNEIENIINLDNLVLFIDYEIFETKFIVTKYLKENIIQFNKDFVLYIKNSNIRNRLVKCRDNNLF